MLRPGLTSLWTLPPPGSPGVPYCLPALGHVQPATYSFTDPGGCDQLTSAIARRHRHEALNAGRTVLAQRGGSVVWAGILDQPVSDGAGSFALSAHGAAGIGTDYRAIYTPPWGTGVFNDAIDQAITRGLPWVRGTNIGAVSGLWTGQAVDSASQSVADLLNLATTKGGLTWQVATGPGGTNTLTVFPLPTAPTRALIVSGPAGVSIAHAPTTLYLRYQATADSANGKTPATYSLTSVTRAAAETAQGRSEDFTDLSSSGLIGSSGAQTVGNRVFARYTRAAFTDPFTAGFGQLLNMGGVPVDPGVFYADGQTAMVCQLLLSDFAQPGEISPGPLRVLIGAYEWDDGALTATLTPFESLRKDWSSLLSAVTSTYQPRIPPHHARKKAGK